MLWETNVTSSGFEPQADITAEINISARRSGDAPPGSQHIGPRLNKMLGFRSQKSAPLGDGVRSGGRRKGEEMPD